jgi:DNA-binding transcriptional ArsR family regulator
LALLGELQHPVRLPILLALNEGEQTAAQLAERVGAEFPAVNYALRQLVKAGYVEIARIEVRESGPGNTTQRVYRGKGEDWARLVTVLDEYARSR